MPTPLGLPLSSLLRPQWGIENPYGTNVACTRSWCCIDNLGFELDDDQQTESSGEAGLAFETREDLIKLSSKGTLKVLPDYRDLFYLIQSFMGAPTDSTLVSGAYQHVVSDQIYTPITPISYTAEAADPGAIRSYKANGIIIPGLKIDTGAGKMPSGSATIEGKKLQDPITISTGQNSVQVLSFSGSPTAGTFIIQDTDTGAQTAAITYSAGLTAGVVQTAIQSLGGDWASATVAGSAGGPYTVTSPTGKTLKLLTAIFTNSAGTGTLNPTNATCSFSYTTVGGMKQNASLLIQGGDIQMGFADSLVNLVNAELFATHQYESKIELGDRIFLDWRQNTNDVQPGFAAQKHAKDIKDKFAITTAYDSSIATLISKSQDLVNSFRYARIQFTGPAIGATGYNHSLTFDIACRPRWRKNRDSAGNIRSVDFDLNATLDKATGFRVRIIGVNDVTTYSTN